MRRVIYYAKVALLDIVRLKLSAGLHVVIVAGICLPILILLALQRGHVAQLRQNLITSPTGRQMIVFRPSEGEKIRAAELDRLAAEIPNIQLIIPLVQVGATLSVPGTQDSARQARNVTCYATRPGDPVMAQAGADVLTAGERAVVLSKTVAEELDVQTGDRLTLIVTRSRQGGQQDLADTASTEIKVKAVLPPSDEKSRIGYLDAGMMDFVQQYLRGYQVAQLGWPAWKEPAVDEYAAYLIFCDEKGLRPNDFEYYRDGRGWTVEDVQDQDLRGLYGLLATAKSEQLKLYRVSSAHSRNDPGRRLHDPPQELARQTLADDVVLPWHEPQVVEIAGVPHRLVGCSLEPASSCWLRGCFREKTAAFDYGADELQIRVPAASPLAAEKKAVLRVGNVDVPVAVAVLPEPAPPQKPVAPPEKPADEPAAAPKPLDVPPDGIDVPPEADEPEETGPAADEPARFVVPASAGIAGAAQVAAPPAKAGTTKNAAPITALVPVQFLAHLTALKDGTAEFDPVNRLFVPVPERPAYGKLLFYPETIDDVPNVVRELERRAYRVISENGRITEIHEQANSLTKLVWVVGVAVFSFGLLTVMIVLFDSTDRRRGAIGILRVMGVSGLGIFGVVFLRALVIGILAGGLTVGCGFLACCVLGHYDVEAIIGRRDIGYVFAGTITCCVFGAVVPALFAAAMDPFENVVQGKFR